MKKIPTIFDRDWEGNKGVINKPIQECDWVFKGEGIATEKVDGTNIKIRIKNGLIDYVWKRRNLTKEEKAKGIEPYYIDAESADPQNKHIFKAINSSDVSDINDGEYEGEAYGGKIQGNPLDVEPNVYFFKIKPEIYHAIPRDYEKLRACLSHLASHFNPAKLAEGIVFHHSDGRMAKIKRKDFKFLNEGEQEKEIIWQR